MTRLRVEVQALGICLILVSHLRRPQGDKGHEGGAQVSLSQLRGSHAIAQLADTCIGLNVDIEGASIAKILKAGSSHNLLEILSSSNKLISAEPKISFISFSSSSNTSISLGVNPSIWSSPFCTTPDAVAKSRYKHTASINVEGSANKMINGLQHFMSRKEVWQSWMRTSVTDNQVETFFKKTVAKAFTRQNHISKTNEKQLENLLGIWADESRSLGQNKWALYNTLTYWATHTGELRSPHTARYNREAAIASAMRNKEWEFA